jgi:Tfp pilus assembly protein PilF
MKKILWSALGVVLAAGLCQAQALSRVQGTITDSQGQGVPAVKISITMKDQPTWKKEVSGDAKGNYEVSFTDGTKLYLFELTAEGFIPLKEEVKPKIFASLEHHFTMKTKKEAEELLRQQERSQNPHLVLFEEGRKAYLSGDMAAARKSLEECLKAKPDFTKASIFLADIDLKEGKADEAIARAEKALNGPDEEKAVALRILIAAYGQKGKKEKVAEYQTRLQTLQPDSPESLFNQAAELLNKKDDAGAKPLLEKAVEINPEFADAWYELGFIYLREGDMAKCKSTFETFLKLVPTGEKAETAKETIKWL